tara:strand:- start:232 stop:486 length:255 start_codon:yes stop_codon:yes gene_type:complete
MVRAEIQIRAVDLAAMQLAHNNLMHLKVTDIILWERIQLLSQIGLGVLGRITEWLRVEVFYMVVTLKILVVAKQGREILTSNIV